ncbi:uncharacterized protein LTR77_001055 [Saxophila tyrrhenica]|uniref:SMP-30/Gluconolactonase/LRE-like region domain-containing protein n=1 Tax=Saxophila tyrrhenica TaxID=1690608 RepID=A0AAV9PM80_9PEZI|nr:hypothetical protein LTR77_001055 [Saxophila tyrrhenica]
MADYHETNQRIEVCLRHIAQSEGKPNLTKWARDYNVPYSRLYARYKGRVTRLERPASHRRLKDTEENLLHDLVNGLEAQDKFAHEAGVYIKSTNRSYFTSNYQSNKTIETYSIDCTTHQILLEEFPDVVNPNGACYYGDQVLYCCQGSLTTPFALVLAHPLLGTSEIMLNSFYGRDFNSLNDVVVHHDAGDIWFTDPTYGYEQAFRPSPLLPSQVYRFRPATGQIWCVADGFVQCNSLCFSPDYDNNVSLNPRLPATIYEFNVTDGRTRLSNRRMFAYVDSGVPDGIKCDERGNVYSGCGDGVHVWDAQGTLLGKIYAGNVVANFNFVEGGIWMMAAEKLFFCEIGVKGALVDIECL